MKLIKKLVTYLFVFAIIFCGGKETDFYDQYVEFPTREKKENQDSFRVKMVDVGNGDCFIISCKSTQILIDCGGTLQSESNIINELSSCFEDDDNLLDYVIMTHGDSDHIINFAGDSIGKYGSPQSDSKGLTKWLINNNKRIGTLIDFDIKNDYSNKNKIKDVLYSNCQSNVYDDEEINDNEVDTVNSNKVYSSYSKAKEWLLNNKKIDNYFVSTQCLYKQRNIEIGNLNLWSNNKMIPSEDVRIDEFLFDEGKGKINILDNVYSYIDCSGLGFSNSLCSNQLSTCVLVTYDNEKYLFTGDLQEFYDNKRVMSDDGVYFGGESELLKRNFNLLKDGVLFYKSGHHGSKTANSDNLLRYIRPQYIGISCDAKKQYGFPHEVPLRVMSQYTDYIYLTHCEDKVFESSGTIYFTYNQGYDDKLTVTRGDKSLNSVLSEKGFYYLQDDVKSGVEKGRNRRVPCRVIELSSRYLDAKSPNSCTYIKLGHIDVLINYGFVNVDKSDKLSEIRNDISNKINYLCNDGVLDYLIISSQRNDSFYGLVGKNNLFDYCPDLKVKNVIVNPVTNRIEDENFVSLIKKMLNDNKRFENVYGAKLQNGKVVYDRTIIDTILSFDLSNVFDSTLQIITSDNKYKLDMKDFCLGVVFTANIKNSTNPFTYVNLGTCTNNEANNSIIKKSNKKMNLLTMPNYGKIETTEEIPNYILENKSKDLFNIVFNCPFGSVNLEGKRLYPSSTLKSFLSLYFNDSIYATRFIKKNDRSQIDSFNSPFDVVISANLPFGDDSSKESLQAIKSFSKGNEAFSNYNLEGTNFSKYNKSKIDNLNLVSYL
ncbi:MAG: hypothetical protein MR345_06345 [Bacilli bacterium]|nr:hypothetical protein [Bacilli bacterium]